MLLSFVLALELLRSGCIFENPVDIIRCSLLRLILFKIAFIDVVVPRHLVYACAVFLHDLEKLLELLGLLFFDCLFAHFLRGSLRLRGLLRIFGPWPRELRIVSCVRHLDAHSGEVDEGVVEEFLGLFGIGSVFKANEAESPILSSLEDDLHISNFTLGFEDLLELRLCDVGGYILHN